MKKQIWIIIILAVIIVILAGVLLWPKSANNNPQPVISGIQIISPKINEEVSSPIKITGKVTGDGWAGFEGQVGTVKLLDATGKELATGILNATTEWTSLPTNFETTLNFQSATAQSGTLVFKNENPSGLPEKDKTFSLPVKITTGLAEIMTVKVYFDSSTDGTCGQALLEASRTIPKTDAVARAALDELLKGPTATEKSQGYATVIPAGSKLNSISIVNGEARADFNEATESGGGSCSMASRVAQITQTLKQFSTVTSVKLSIDGRTGDIFQP